MNIADQDQCRRQVFANLWHYYKQKVPFAPTIEQALQQKGDLWIEDHVAFRSLPGEHCGAHVLQGVFEALGYSRQDDYHFAEKKLDAFWMAPPDTTGMAKDASPKIFISQLIPDSFSADFQKTLRFYTDQVRQSPLAAIRRLQKQMQEAGDKQEAAALVDEITSFLTALPPWSRPVRADYEILQKESEYASWTLLYGNQINHFTLSVHLMQNWSTIAELGQYIEDDLKIPMNHVGGMVKGSTDLSLEQIATKAVRVPYQFQDGVQEEFYGFVEFAKRYPQADQQADGKWQSYYQGFVTSNADKIFESTYR